MSSESGGIGVQNESAAPLKGNGGGGRERPSLLRCARRRNNSWSKHLICPPKCCFRSYKGSILANSVMASCALFNDGCGAWRMAYIARQGEPNEQEKTPVPAG